MTQTWTTWLLGGALLASLAWNLRDTGVREERTNCCAALDLSQLDLSDEQQRELRKWMTSACDESCRANAESGAAFERLLASLRDPTTPPERVRELVDDVGRARSKALQSCADSIIAVRRVLNAEQLAKLLDNCCSATECAR